MYKGYSLAEDMDQFSPHQTATAKASDMNLELAGYIKKVNRIFSPYTRCISHHSLIISINMNIIQTCAMHFKMSKCLTKLYIVSAREAVSLPGEAM